MFVVRKKRERGSVAKNGIREAVIFSGAREQTSELAQGIKKK